MCTYCMCRGLCVCDAPLCFGVCTYAASRGYTRVPPRTDEVLLRVGASVQVPVRVRRGDALTPRRLERLGAPLLRQRRPACLQVSVLHESAGTSTPAENSDSLSRTRWRWSDVTRSRRNIAASQLPPAQNDDGPYSSSNPSSVHPPSAVRRPPSAARRPSSVVRRPSSVVRRPSSVVRRPSSVVRRPSSVVRRPSSVVRRPSSVVRRPSSVVRRPSSVVRRPSSVVRRPSSVVRRPSSVVRRPSSVARRPSPVAPVARRPSPVARRPSPVARRPSPVARRPSPVARRPSPVARRPSPVARRPSSVVRRPSSVVRRPSPVARRPSPVARRSSPVARRPSPFALRPSPVARRLFARRPPVHHSTLLTCPQLDDVALSTDGDGGDRPGASDWRLAATLESKYLLFDFIDGRIAKVCPQPGDVAWAVNIKLGVLAMLQNTMQRLDRNHSTYEVSGRERG